jgi:hypothetical protein
MICLGLKVACALLLASTIFIPGSSEHTHEEEEKVSGVFYASKPVNIDIDVSDAEIDQIVRLVFWGGIDRITDRAMALSPAYNKSYFLSGSSGSSGSSRNRGFRERHIEPGFEFKQELDLYAMHSWPTKYDHSGTVTYTYRRKRGSQDPWGPPYRIDCSCNHGSCPHHYVCPNHGDKEMKLRERCKPGVVIDGWYGVDGECRGECRPIGWGKEVHLCNDDTALQINNAHGIWTGDICRGTVRGIIPSCHVHWTS